MSALADALVAAQRRAIVQLEKVYVVGGFEDDRMHELLDAIGCTDAVDQDHLIDTLRAYGGTLPTVTNGASERKDPATEPATDAQWTLLHRLAGEKKQPAPDGPLTKAQAHEIIDTLKAGTYDAAKWSVPF